MFCKAPTYCILPASLQFVTAIKVRARARTKVGEIIIPMLKESRIEPMVKFRNRDSAVLSVLSVFLTIIPSIVEDPVFLSAHSQRRNDGHSIITDCFYTISVHFFAFYSSFPYLVRNIFVVTKYLPLAT